MKKINCDIIKDVLPLYLDDVVSNATKEMVEEHLSFCDSCRRKQKN
ncbi:zf-HC2 domain-containing protein [Coprococcus sp. AF21-14LB]|nr:zf-HC2 domain-containing protein [Coprococcus sp. AF21-14LB]RGS79135.1 zf-HC2 domain-containing protein [Coprococcus sp. AF21-14LB]